MRRIAPALAALALGGTAAPALAQSDEGDAPSPDMMEGSALDGDYIQLGIGVAYSADYDGSDDYEAFPLPLIRGRIGGIDIQPRAAGVALDVVPDGDGDVAFSFGPALRLRTSRTGDIEDPVVAAAGELDTAVEIGPSAGISYSGLLNPYDSIGVNVDARWDIAGAHEGMTISPSITYFTPVSRGAAVSLSLSAEHGDDDFNSYYFSVTPAQALASGLPAYEADGGFNKVGATLLGAFDLDGDLTNGGFALFAMGGYSKVIGDAADSPYVAQRGDADQWIVGAGIGYTF
ncbi:MipA/OmpV family protein [Citromicrobium bathyomarinum]|uniref:MipA/OmpV family protein n=1 Tax=Citromicrobium TaxID=72173 RepID=UPI00030EAED7|nr:MipA/OmpV family protein [Citromicrobium sp. JLT1363]